MNCAKICFFVLLFFTFFSNRENYVCARGINGGMKCATCTVVMGLMEQSSVIHNETIAASLERMCNYLPDKFHVACKLAVEFVGPIIIDIFTVSVTPDVVCHTLDVCYSDSGGKYLCHLFPYPDEFIFRTSLKKARRRLNQHLKKKNLTKLPDLCSWPGIKELCEFLIDIFSYHEPGVDEDKDSFSVLPELRGTAWRGRDCRDNDASVYPGKRPTDGDIKTDSNCNGIHGVNPDTGKPFEEELCGDSGQLGVIVLGDSASAHFHAPAEWFTAKDLTKAILSNLTYVVENEGDWPDLSYFTGYRNSTWPIVHGPTDSIYRRLWKRNHCVHRDYQNLAVNGASSYDLLSYRKALARDKENDFPAFVAIALVGNDVCNHYADTVAHMTTVAQMKDNLLDTLQWLDDKLPNGSHVMLGGLADGRILYESLHDRIHPIGKLRNDVRYRDVYDWFNCLLVTPCLGWMNTNETLRDFTSKRAAALSKVMSDVAKEYHTLFENFDINFVNCPMQEAINIWVEQGGEVWELIEPADGFHPNQIGNALIADVLWQKLIKEFPHVVGKENPYNGRIEEIFGDQGGY